MLRQLRSDPKDFKGALLHVDRRVRMMMLFELQSLVWNEGVKRYLGRMLPSSEMIGLRYQAGSLSFPRSLTREAREALWAKTFPLLAPDSEIDDPLMRASALEALAAQGLRLEQLAVPNTPMFFKHEERPLFIRPGKLRVNEPRPDEINRGKLKLNLSFTLPPGAYASLVVRRVLWYADQRTSLAVKPAPPRERERERERKPQTPKKGFLERQRERKAARAQRRAGHKPS
jgi:tRNA pseudouridine13 synthase